jgi:HAE1 family hydrophobic/amphiphilic exporter-1
MSLSDFSVDRPVTITMIVMIILVVGALSLSKVGLDMMPDVDFPTVSVVTRYEGASSEDVEKLVTRTIEGAVASVNGVVGVTSTSQEDSSFVLVNFEWGTDLDAAAQDMREALGLVEPLLPDGAEDPMVLKFSLSAIPVLSYLVSGMEGNTVALRDYLEDTLTQRLERLDGVAGVVLMGGRDQEVQVRVRRNALDATGLSLDTVVQALAAQNLNLPAGRVVESRNEFLVRTLGEFGDLETIRQAVVGMQRDGTPVRVRDVATVEMGLEDLRNAIRSAGVDGLYLMVNKRSGANPLKVSQKVKDELAAIQRELPEDIGFNLVIDTGSQIENMASNVSQTGLLGGFLAIVFMFGFLRSLRPTFAIAAAIPLSLLVTFIPIYIVGETLNLMTMGGLLLGIGMLVDNAVVVIENIFRHLEEGTERKEAARKGAREIGMAITASTLTTMAVFLPLFFGGGLAGELVRGLAMVVAFALGASLLVALTIVPMLASVFFSRREALKAQESSAAFERVKAGYERVLRWCLSHRWVTLSLAGVVMVGSLGGMGILGAEFMPSGDQPVVMGLVKFPVGTPYGDTDRAVKRIEEFARTIDGVATVGSSVGVNEDDLGAGLSEMSPSGVHEAQVFVRLADERARGQAAILEELRAEAPATEGMTVEFFDMGGMMFGGNQAKPVQIQIRGAELMTLRRAGDRVAETIAGIEGIKDVSTSFKAAKPERHLVIDRDKAASYGLTVAEVARSVETATQGRVAGLYRTAGDEHPIRVRYEAGDRSSFADLDRIVVPTRAGFAIPLRQVAAFQDGMGPVRIHRDNQSRQVTVYANIEGRDLGSVFGDIDDALVPVKQGLPRGYRIDYGGTYEDMVDAFIQLLGALALAILLVYMVMASQFEAFVHPLVIMVTLPLSIIGVALALGVTATPVSVVTFVGLIMLAGIVVNNGIVLVDFINQLRREGVERREAIVKGGSTRLRAVLITSGTTIAGLLPMAIAPARGAEMTGDMALTVAGGLAASTFLTLVVLPVVYEWFDSMGGSVRKLMVRLVHGADEAAALDEAAEGSPA